MILTKKKYFTMNLLLLISIISMLSSVSYASESNLLPRFASLKADEVNLRVGPHKQNFPISWVYKRRGLPIEITGISDKWRRIRDYEGTTGWVWHSLISNKRTIIVINKNRTLHLRPDDNSGTSAILEPGVLGNLLECNNKWCQIEVKGIKGWLKRPHFWGVGANETFTK
ncbi:MAG: hypothetical protein CMM30_08150 [Rhodospirillaceae bacterium]|nr:hypothetical protein [Alphaproteobacteria bacterium]MBR72893.1 hypothetical protein [Rhodospirillaceae bacterium]|tara:strand:- start:20385 stop:20894 length:510 start_codon:yes stop_codon:yes gene_type:complete